MEFINIGRIVAPFGLDGRMKVQPITDFLERFDPGEEVFIEEKAYTVLSRFMHKSQVRVKLAGIDHIDQVLALKWQYLKVPVEKRPLLDENEYYVQDLIGMIVVDQCQRLLGRIEKIEHSPAQDLMYVGKLIIPAASQFVKKVDLSQKKVYVHLIPGMEDV